MEGKVFDGVISFLEEMKFKKDFFHQKRWSWEKNDLNKFSPKTTPLKTQGMKNEILHFGTFSVRDETFSKYISIKFFFFFGREIYFQSLSRV